MKLEPNWKHGLRWFSVQANLASQLIIGGWIFLRDQPLPQYIMWVVWAILIAGFIGRFIYQKDKSE